MLNPNGGSVGIGVSSTSLDTEAKLHIGPVLWNQKVFTITDWDNTSVFSVLGYGKIEMKGDIAINVTGGVAYYDAFKIKWNGNDIFRITYDGLTQINNTLKAKRVQVSVNVWSDYVFDNDYKLRTLNELEEYIKTNKHLPDVPSEKEVFKKGIDLGEMDGLLLRKIEELTLYIIEQEKRIKNLEEKIKKK